MQNPEQYQTRNITTADASSTVVVRNKGTSSDGFLGYVMVLVVSAQAVPLYDGIDATGDLITTLPASLPIGTYALRRACKKGIAAVVPVSFVGTYVVGYL